MAQQFVSGSADSIPAVNGGVALSMGSSTDLLSARAPQTPDLGVHGSTVVEGLNATAKAIGGGTFAHNHQRPLGFKVTEELGGVPNPALKTTQNPSAWINAKHPRNKVRTRQLATAIRNGQLNLFTGDISPAPVVTNDPWYSISAAGTVTDIADADKTVDDTPPTPGNLTYVVGGRPSVDSYKPRTKW